MANDRGSFETACRLINDAPRRFPRRTRLQSRRVSNLSQRAIRLKWRNLEIISGLEPYGLHVVYDMRYPLRIWPPSVTDEGANTAWTLSEDRAAGVGVGQPVHERRVF